MNYSLSLNNLINAESPIIMGILNITSDSFSDGGKFLDQDAAISQASLLLTQGASIIDIGAESSGLGSSAISADEEIRRMQDIVKPIAETCILSIDTYNAKTAEFCLKQGATIINDISALRADKELI